MRFDPDAAPLGVVAFRPRERLAMTDEAPAPRGGLMQGKRGLIMGVANDHSIAWGIAKTLSAQGAQLAFTYQGEALGKRVKPLAQSLDSSLVLPCDVDNLDSVDKTFGAIGGLCGREHPPLVALDGQVTAILKRDAS